MKVSYDFKELGVNETNRQEYINLLDTKLDYFVESKYISNTKVAIDIEYDIADLMCYDDLKDSTKVFKLQAISNVIKLVQNTNNLLAINIKDADNLYFTSEGACLQLVKGLDSTRLDESQYSDQIKGLIGNLLTKDSCDAITASSGELLKKDKLLANLADIDNLDDMHLQLNQIISQVTSYEHDTLVAVNKSFVTKTKSIGRIKTLIILILLVVTVFLAAIYIPNRTSQLKAITSYEDKVYEDVLTNLEKTNINAMSPVVKYIEVESTIRLSQLSDTQKDNILYNLSPSVEEGILDFWVYIGQENLDAAYDQSIKNNDAQQKAYVLLLLIDQTQNDTDLKQDEKDSMLSTYQGELDSITSSMAEESGDE